MLLQNLSCTTREGKLKSSLLLVDIINRRISFSFMENLKMSIIVGLRKSTKYLKYEINLSLYSIFFSYVYKNIFIKIFSHTFLHIISFRLKIDYTLYLHLQGLKPTYLKLIRLYQLLTTLVSIRLRKI